MGLCVPWDIFVNTWWDFAAETTVCGACNAGLAKTKFRRFIWMIFFLVNLAATIVVMYQLIVSFLTFPTTTSIGLERYSQISFPGVTVCNQNRVDCNRLRYIIALCENYPANCTLDNNSNGTTLTILKRIELDCPPQNSTTTTTTTTAAPGRRKKRSLLGGLGNLVTNVVSTVTNLTTDLTSGVSNVTTDLTSGLTNVTSGLTNVTSGLTSGLSNVTTDLTSGLTNATTGLTSGLTNVTSSLSNVTTDLTSGLTNVTSALTSTLSNVTSGLSNVTSGLTSGLSNVTSGLTSGLTDLTAGLTSGLTSSLTNLLSDLGFSSAATAVGATPVSVDKEYMFLIDYMTLSENDRQQIGHAFSDFVLSCIFRQKNCLNESYFYLTSSPIYGNCYTFNSGNNTKDDEGGTRVTSMSGPAFGIQLVLNIDQPDYLENGRTPQAGARFVVHDPANRAMTEEYGYDVLPNTLTGVSVQQLSLSRLPAPYLSNCTSSWDSTNYTDFVPAYPGWNYTLALCNRVCLQSTFESDCGCFHPFYLDSDQDRHGYDPCNITTGSNDYNCIVNIIQEFDLAERNCSCNVNCEEEGYELAMSASNWPSDSFLATVAEGLGMDNSSSGSSGDNSELAKNLLQLQVYFTTLNVQSITENPVYSWSDGSYVSAFGGAIGLFLGIALVSIFEIFEFVIDYCINVYMYYFKGKRTDKKEEEEEDNDKMDKISLNKTAIVPYSPGFTYREPKI